MQGGSKAHRRAISSQTAPAAKPPPKTSTASAAQSAPARPVSHAGAAGASLRDRAVSLPALPKLQPTPVDDAWAAATIARLEQLAHLGAEWRIDLLVEIGKVEDLSSLSDDCLDRLHAALAQCGASERVIAATNLERAGRAIPTEVRQLLGAAASGSGQADRKSGGQVQAPGQRARASSAVLRHLVKLDELFRTARTLDTRANLLKAAVKKAAGAFEFSSLPCLKQLHAALDQVARKAPESDAERSSILFAAKLRSHLGFLIDALSAGQPGSGGAKPPSTAGSPMDVIDACWSLRDLFGHLAPDACELSAQATELIRTGAQASAGTAEQLVQHEGFEVASTFAKDLPRATYAVRGAAGEEVVAMNKRSEGAVQKIFQALGGDRELLEAVTQVAQQAFFMESEKVMDSARTTPVRYDGKRGKLVSSERPHPHFAIELRKPGVAAVTLSQTPTGSLFFPFMTGRLPDGKIVDVMGEPMDVDPASYYRIEYTLLVDRKGMRQLDGDVRFSFRIMPPEV
ncbi:hypothetical protein JI739_22775 [Ramlibacter sp. AW1]|uniref:Uncharacterized protein n=1 Tax=Ramlibacter aurantiacus TaxID=2801330 RepID=A0A936ZN14_9BURK|nr:hypothetical protein [Ramlibacter aurantiacus]MBL0423178.1 hypothetical protein [Ramlibacter aurantiacus]